MHWNVMLYVRGGMAQGAAHELSGYDRGGWETHFLLNELEHEELIDLISHMWEMVFADGRMHETEVIFVERVAKLLNFPQDEVTRAMTL